MWCGTPAAGFRGKKNSVEWACPTARPVMELFPGWNSCCSRRRKCGSRGCDPSFPEHVRKFILFTEGMNFAPTKVLQDKLFKCANVEMVWDSVPTVIGGTDKGRKISKVHNVKTDEGKTIAVGGVFIAVGILPEYREIQRAG